MIKRNWLAFGWLFVLTAAGISTVYASAIDTYATGDYTKFLSPPSYIDDVTKSDTVDLPHVSRSIYVGGTGDITVILKDGTSHLFKAVPTGTTLNIRVTRVMSTGTSATLLLSEY